MRNFKGRQSGTIWCEIWAKVSLYIYNQLRIQIVVKLKNRTKENTYLPCVMIVFI